MDDYAPCQLCKQYSHSIPETAIAAAFMHFQSMVAHPVRGTPMGDMFDAQTRDAAQVLVAALERQAELIEQLRTDYLDDAKRWQFDSPGVRRARATLRRIG